MSTTTGGRVPEAPAAPAAEKKGLVNWVVGRLGLNATMEDQYNRIVPNHATNYIYCFGGIAFVLFIILAITGILLAVARMSGETAPLLFTALNNQFWSLDMNAPMANLPVVIFQFALSPYDDWKDLAWGGAFLITLTVLVINVLARTVFRQSAVR
jgi:hypothetical protein